MKIAKFSYDKNMKIKEFKHPCIMVATLLGCIGHMYKSLKQFKHASILLAKT
jgi:hypothetical protein